MQIPNVATRDRALMRFEGAPQQMVEAMASEMGNKARTRIHLLNDETVETILPLELAADMLGSQPGQLLLVPRRDASGRIHAAYIRAGAIGWIEVA